jgi:small GTP-binding protein
MLACVFEHASSASRVRDSAATIIGLHRRQFARMADRRSFRVAFTGDPNTGKTSIIQKILRGDTDISEIAPTIGADLFAYDLHDGIQIELQDCPGKVQYQSILPVVYRNTGLIVILFSFDSKQSYDHVADWRKKADDFANGTKVVLVGNKVDLVDSLPDWAPRAEDLTDGTVIEYLETSGLTGRGLNDLKELIEREARNSKVETMEVVILNGKTDKKDEKPTCC